MSYSKYDILTKKYEYIGKYKSRGIVFSNQWRDVIKSCNHDEDAKWKAKNRNSNNKRKSKYSLEENNDNRVHLIFLLMMLNITNDNHII